jgi:hypothetical protein
MSGEPVVGQVIEDASVRPAKPIEISALTNKTFDSLVTLMSPHGANHLSADRRYNSEDCATGAVAVSL